MSRKLPYVKKFSAAGRPLVSFGVLSGLTLVSFPLSLQFLFGVAVGPCWPCFPASHGGWVPKHLVEQRHVGDGAHPSPQHYSVITYRLRGRGDDVTGG